MWQRTLLASIIASGVAAHAADVQAGPIVDWLLNRRYGESQPYTAALPVAPGTPYASNAAALGGFNVPQTVVAAMPAGGYQTVLNNVPTTYYRPVTSLDPVTGTTVTTLQPCTSYQQQALRVPTLLPTAASPSYYAAYGTYGMGLAQNRYSPITGSGIAAASGQSSLSIPSSLGSATPSMYAPTTAVQQLPIGGINGGVVTANYNSYAVALPTVAVPNPAFPSAVVPAASYPVTANYQAYSNPTLPIAANYFSNPTAATLSPGYTLGTATAPSYGHGTSVTQADGTIVTPLGPPTLSAAPLSPLPAADTQPVPQPPAAAQPGYSSSFGSYDNAAQRYPDGTIVTPLGSGDSGVSPGTAAGDPPALLQPRESYSPPAAKPYDPNCPDTSVLPPSSNGTASGQPYQSQPYQSQPYQSQPYQSQPYPSEVYPPQSVSPPASSGYDSESNVRPTLPFTPATSANARQGEVGRMVAIDRPAANFSRRPIDAETDLGTATQAMNVGEGSSFDSLVAPSLLPSGGSESSPSYSRNAIVAPRGVDPKPYWRSEQKAATPGALQSAGEKTASRNAVPQAFAESTRPVDSPAPIRWISQSSAAPETSAVQRSAFDVAPPAATSTRGQVRPSTQGNYPAKTPLYDDGFRAAQ